jgi:hypothetical protein
LTDVAQHTTILNRKVSGSFLVYISGAGSGAFSPTMLGSMTSEKDETEFSFNHLIGGQLFGEGDTVADRLTSNNINFVNHAWAGTAVDADGGDHSEDDGPVAMPVGTVWQPLESSPQLTIYMR